MIGHPDSMDDTPGTADAPAPDSEGRARVRRGGRGPRWLILAASLAAIVGAILLLQRWKPDAGGAANAGTDAGYVSFETAGIKIGASSGPPPKVGQPAPDFALPSLDGTVLRPRDLRGQVVLLNFWATWCPPCRKEMPLFNQAAAEYRDRGVIIVAINIQENRDQVRGFAEEFGITFPILLDTAGDVTKQYRVQGLPTSYLIDRDGVVRDVKVGEFNRARLDEKIAPLLGAPAP